MIPVLLFVFLTPKQPLMALFGDIDGKIAQFRAQAPPHLDPDRAIWWAVFRAEGGDPEKACFISCSEMDADEPHFWRGFLRMAARSKPRGMTDPDVADLITFLRLVCLGKGPLIESEDYQPFAAVISRIDWNAHTLSSLKKKLEKILDTDYEEIEGMHDAYSISGPSGGMFRIVRLTCREELLEEGGALSSYIRSIQCHLLCLMKKISVWSLREAAADGSYETVATLILRERKIIKVSGRSPSPSQKHLSVVRRWAEINRNWVSF
jgi:hypothetical protein